MKIRTGFVSNSSSSSFLIEKDYLSPQQIKQIKDHKKFCIEKFDFPWTIKETKNLITMSVMMDNFDMKDYLISTVKVDPKYIRGGRD